MANKYPLVYNTTTTRIEELVTTDNLDVTNGGLIAGYLTSSGSVGAASFGLELTGSLAAVGSEQNRGLLKVGTLGFADSNLFVNYQTSANSYAQIAVQNTNAGTAASTDVVVHGNGATSTTRYGDFGINSTGYTGGGAFGDAGGTYLYSVSGTLAIGTLDSFAVKFFANATTNTTPALTLNTDNTVALTTNAKIGNTTIAQGGSVTVTLPTLTGTLATLAAVETLQSKTYLIPYTEGAGTALTNPESSAQVLFPAAGDTITLSVGLYQVDMLLRVTRGATSTTSSALRIVLLGNGNAVGTFNGIAISSIADDAATNAFHFAAVNINNSSTITAASITASGVYNARVTGIMKITTAGTIIPTYRLTNNLTGGTTSTTCSAANYMTLLPISTTGTTTSQGGWA
jgi:hypothetical protein